MSNKKILVVDDDQDLVEVLKARLESNQFDVVTAYNGEECLKKSKTEKPDLIILDGAMPVMDGYTALLELKENNETKDIPVIMLTGKPELRELFSVEGATDYLLKPFDADDLLLRIKWAFDDQK